ncbi:uncharacterized protein LOC126679019 [Mercurialis annua]|uniref:uncharacterized protein LOC126679019 n=1 Tax=Mercurialis annua TaxID=3986 RepID=UPI00215EDEF7|nr:uncharacterized protein LOC126679019 [Mercurialis annua]
MAFSSKETIIQAKEDLKILETLHPDRFEYLKLELKSFISFLESQCSSDNSIASFDQLVSTQASTYCEKNDIVKDHQEMEEERDEFEEVKKKKKDRVELVLEKAECCLRKIQEFKATLC